MRAVKVTVKKEHWLAALRDLLAASRTGRADRLVRLRFDPAVHALALIDRDPDSSCKITLPMQATEARSVLECLVSADKLEPIHRLLQSGTGVISIVCRSTTLSFQIGNKRFHVPNRIVEPRPGDGGTTAAFQDPAGGPEQGLPAGAGGFVGPDPLGQVVRFLVPDLQPVLQAVEACKGSAVLLRIGDGLVRLHTLEFPAKTPVSADYLLPGEPLYHRLLQLPTGVPVHAAMDGSLLRFSGAAAEVQRTVTINPYPSTTLYIATTEPLKKSGEENRLLWTNASRMPGSERRKAKDAGHPKCGGHESGSRLPVANTEHPPPAAKREEPLLAPDGESLDATEAPPAPTGAEPSAVATDLPSPPEPGQSVKPGEPAQSASAQPMQPFPETAASALSALEQLPGLTLVKRQIREIAQFAAFQKKRMEALGVPAHPPTLHMAFLGNPGTGKTMVARMIGRILKELGLLAKGHLVEVDRQSLVGAYMGHTEANLAKYVKRALGGVLFIDEAYTLYKKDSGKDFGLTVIHGLVKIMEDFRDRLVVILAGYKQEMQEFMNSNPGLRERIPFHLEFPDYTEAELLHIGEHLALQDHYVLADDAKEALVQQALRQKIDETFANARTVRNLLEKAKIRHAVRVAGGEQSAVDFATLTADDFFDEERPNADGCQQALAELDQLVGLERVKECVRQIVDVLNLEQKRRQYGLADEPLTLHMAFLGNPGTGKTTVARLLGRIFRRMGLLPKGQLVEVSRRDLVAGYIGQTAIKTAEKVKQALGGVLFIDEAYALAGRSRDDFGQEAIATLIKEMEDKKGLLAVILAGYPKEMEALFRLNPGLKSRIRFTIEFPDYTASELVEIVKRKAAASHYRLTEAAEETLWAYFLRQCLAAGSDFGNGRLAEAVFEQAKMRLSMRVGRLRTEDPELLCTITEEDLATD